MENGAAHYDAILHAVTLVCSKTTSVERPCHLKKTRRAITPDQARRLREEGLKSRSHGEEPHRYVTVYLKNRVEDTAEDDELDQE